MRCSEILPAPKRQRLARRARRSCSFASEHACCNGTRSEIQKADDANTVRHLRLLDHLVGKLLELRWHVEAECRGGLEVDHEIEPLRALYR
jgi:hypothetical protein